MENVSEELRSMRETISHVADQLTRIGVGPKLMNTEEAGEFLGVGRDVMYQWRKAGEGPPYLHITSRTIRYDRDQLVAWAQSHVVGK